MRYIIHELRDMKKVRAQGPQKGEAPMKIVESIGVNYEVKGEREAEAAVTLEEGLSAVSKRRNAYIDSSVDDVINVVSHDFNVSITPSLAF